MTGPIDVPAVDWAGLLPITSLVVGAVLALLAAAMVPGRLVERVAPAFTLSVALVSMGGSVALWQRLGDDAPFATIGGAVAVDRFGAFVALAVAAAIVLSTLLAPGWLRPRGHSGVELYVLLLLSGAGGVVLAMANDLVVLFLGLEILSISLYVLAGYDVARRGAREAALKYFVLGGFSSAFLLYGIALLYGATGTTNLGRMGDFLAGNLPRQQGLLLAGLALLMVGLAFKVAAVPFHNWAPDVYQGSPPPVTAFMASAAKAAGFAGILRLLVTTFAPLQVDWRPVVWVLALASLVLGSVLAIVQDDVRRMLAYSSIGHVGFILLGVYAGSARGVGGSLFYLAAYTFMVVGSFGVVTVLSTPGGDDDRHPLSTYRGLAARRPLLAGAFTILLLAQAGVPFTSGFVAKFVVIGAAVEEGTYVLAVVAMLTSVISASMYLRIVLTMYLVDPDPRAARIAVPAGAAVCLALAVGVTVLAGFVPSAALDAARDAMPVLLGSP